MDTTKPVMIAQPDTGVLVALDTYAMMALTKEVQERSTAKPAVSIITAAALQAAHARPTTKTAARQPLVFISMGPLAIRQAAI